ncbi:hypothetical protein ACJX0J_011032, partial [Zea mays]
RQTFHAFSQASMNHVIKSIVKSGVLILDIVPHGRNCHVIKLFKERVVSIIQSYNLIGFIFEKNVIYIIIQDINGQSVAISSDASYDMVLFLLGQERW